LSIKTCVEENGTLLGVVIGTNFMSYTTANKTEAAQESRQSRPEDAALQFVDSRSETAAQLARQEMMAGSPQTKGLRSMQAAMNNTGLPSQLKSGIESLSGLSMDDVRVHYNSDKPAQLHAHAYAQGNEIHVAPGQERHLPHEAWHVVQQAQGRVRPTMQMKGDVPVNDDAGLEAEADLMGQKALQAGADDVSQGKPLRPLNPPARPDAAAQRRPWLDNPATGVYRDTAGTNYAFVTTQGGKANRGVFIPYANLYALYALIAPLVADARATQGLNEAAAINQLSNMYAFGPAALFAAVQPVHMESGRVLINIGNLAPYPGIILGLVKLGAQGFPNLRNEGGGSRLPAAEGSLYISRPHFATKALVLASLNIPVDKFPDYDGVNAVLVDSFGDAVARAALDKQAGANTFAGDGFVYASTVRAPASASRKYTANGRNYDDTFSNIANPSLAFTRLNNAYEALAGPADSGWVSDLAGGRDGDQNTVMGKWGALGAAAFHNAFRSANGGVVPVDQNWEWLHIRGAQIGGETEQGNLLAGTFVANSQMIPFESQIQRWHQGNHGKIFARFTATVRDRILAQSIKIEISALDHPALGTIPQDAPLTIEFFPLDGVVIDKLTGKIQQKKFREQAEGRVRDFEVRRARWAEPERPLPFGGRQSSGELVLANDERQLFDGFAQSGVLISQSPTELSAEGSFDHFFGSYLRLDNPLPGLASRLRLLGQHGFSIHVPDFGFTFNAEQLSQPELIFQRLVPNQLRLNAPPAADDDVDEPGLVSVGTKRKHSSSVKIPKRLRIKIYRPANYQAADWANLTSGAPPQLQLPPSDQSGGQGEPP
jgi:hypothetical protein